MANLKLHKPLDGDIRGRRLNRTLHGRSVHRPANVSGHNVVRGYSRAGTGDAVDLFGNAGEPVYATHAGRITAISDGNGRLSAVYLSGKVGKTLVETVSAHIKMKAAIEVGAQVKRGQVIGYINRILQDPHLHFELWINGRSVNAATPGALRDAITEQLAEG